MKRELQRAPTVFKDRVKRWLYQFEDDHSFIIVPHDIMSVDLSRHLDRVVHVIAYEDLDGGLHNGTPASAPYHVPAPALIALAFASAQEWQDD